MSMQKIDICGSDRRGAYDFNFLLLLPGIIYGNRNCINDVVVGSWKEKKEFH